MASANDSFALSRNVSEDSDENMEEESASDEFVKFLMSHNVALDVCQDSHFRALLSKVAQQGRHASLFLDNSTVIQKSLLKFEDEIRDYMRMVIDSWSTTGCSLMSYNIKRAGGNLLVLGYYCPKGFIFLKGGQSEEEVGKELADLTSNSFFEHSDKVVQFVRHDCYYLAKCQYQAVDVTTKNCSSCYYVDSKCVAQQIHVFWMSICKESRWVQSLIKKSDEIFYYIATSHLYEVFYKNVKETEADVSSTSFSRLCIVLSIRSELIKWVSHFSKNDRFLLQINTDITSIIHNNEFWNEGNQLVQVLSPFYKIPSLMNTLVPTAGYLGLALEKASGLLKNYSKSEPLKYEQIWKCFRKWLSDDYLLLNQTLPCFLHPSYYVLGEDVLEGEIGNFLEQLCMFTDLSYVNEDDKKVVDDELDAYCNIATNPFAGVSEAEFEANHPITLWSKYGSGFPFLQSCANKLLSQPASCLCKQVEKHASKLEGSDNFILRLNGMMMEEFVKLGDQIYQPIHI